MLVLTLRNDNSIVLETVEGEITIKLDASEQRHIKLAFDLPDSVIARRTDVKVWR